MPAIVGPVNTCTSLLLMMILFDMLLTLFIRASDYIDFFPCFHSCLLGIFCLSLFTAVSVFPILYADKIVICTCAFLQLYTIFNIYITYCMFSWLTSICNTHDHVLISVEKCLHMCISVISINVSC